jgi:hypothetical protein
MKNLQLASAVGLLCMLVGCESQKQILADEQSVAMQAAVKRGQFELSCASASGAVLSSTLLQPALYNGLERAEYTIGVSGCGKRTTYISVCQINATACFAASGNRLQGP